MRICFATSSYPTPTRDYVGIAVERMAKHLANRGHSVMVVTPRKANGRVENVIVFDNSLPAALALGDKNLLQIARSNGLLLLIVPFLFFFIAVGRAIRKYHPDVVHAHWAVPSALAALPWCLALRLPLIITCHGSDVNVVPRFPLGSLILRTALRDANKILVTDTRMFRAMLALGQPRSKVKLVPLPALDDSWMRQPVPRRGEFQLMSERVVLFVGRLDCAKGVEFLIRAMPKVKERFRDSSLWIVGDGPDRERLVQLSNSLVSENSVHMFGSISHSKLAWYVRRAEICVSPSLSEGLPFFISECMQFGKAIVATDVGGSRDLIKQGVTGLLVEPANPNALAEAIMTLLADRELRYALGRNAKSFVANYLATDKICTHLEAIYNHAIHAFSNSSKHRADYDSI